MTRIRIETDVARHIARQLMLSGEAVALIVRDLEVATSDVDDYACQGRAAEELADELAGLRGVAEGWEVLGDRLHAVIDKYEQADEFEQPDYAAILALLGQGAWINGFGGGGPTNEECLVRLEELFLTEGREWTEEEWKQYFARGREWGDEDWDLFLDVARGAPLEWRQAGVRAIIENVHLLDGFEAREEATLIVAVLLEGSLTWSLPWEAEEGSEHLLAWLDADWGDEARANLPDPAVAQMNCWQYVLYAAYISGQVSYDDLVLLHQQARSPATTNNVVISQALGVGEAVSNRWHVGDEAPPRGSLVFFDGTGHVAISLGPTEGGDAEILSLWIMPYEKNQRVLSVQRTTIADLLRDAEEKEEGVHEVKEIHWGPNPLGDLGRGRWRGR